MTIYRHKAIVNFSRGEFQFRRCVDSFDFIPVPVTFFSVSKKSRIELSATMLPNCITDAARCSCGLEREITSKVVVRVLFGFTLARAERPIIVPLRHESKMRANREI